MKYDWILVSNSSLARIYSIPSSRYNSPEIMQVTEINHPQAHGKRHDLISDKPGHYKTPGPARGAYESPDPKEVEADKFAKQVAELLEQGRVKHQYQNLVIIASPHFHGLLEKHFSKYIQALIKHCLLKDYVNLSIQELHETLHNLCKL